MCLRRVMVPGIDIDTLIFCAYEDVHLFFDNSDGVFNSDYYKRNAMDAFSYTLEELEELYSCTLEWLRSKAPKSGIVLKSGVAYGGSANVAIRDIKYEQLDLYYDRALGVKENLIILQQIVGFPISRRTLYRYCHDRGIPLNVTDEEVLTMLDLALSVRDNHAMLQDAGVRIGTKRINRLLKSARDQQAQQPPITPEQPLSVSVLGSTTTDTTANGWSGWAWSSYTSPFGF